MSLDELKPGQKAKVLKIAGNGPLRRRLFDMGFRTGEIVKVVRRAPFNDPLEIALSSGHLSIRRKEAAFVSVEVVSASK